MHASSSSYDINTPLNTPYTHSSSSHGEEAHTRAPQKSEYMRLSFIFFDGDSEYCLEERVHALGDVWVVEHSW